MAICSIDHKRSYTYSVFTVLYCVCGFFVFDTEKKASEYRMSKHIEGV